LSQVVGRLQPVTHMIIDEASPVGLHWQHCVGC
jgi:hypothetical protein